MKSRSSSPIKFKVFWTFILKRLLFALITFFFWLRHELKIGERVALQVLILFTSLKKLISILNSMKSLLPPLAGRANGTGTVCTFCLHQGDDQNFRIKGQKTYCVSKPGFFKKPLLVAKELDCNAEALIGSLLS